MAPRKMPPSATVPASTNASSASSQSIGSQRRCMSQKRAAMIRAVPRTDPLRSRRMLPAISATKAGRPV